MTWRSTQNAFYDSMAWRLLQATVRKQRGGICERCYARGVVSCGEIIHHIIPLTPENVDDPEVALNPENLMLVCRKCHGELHDSRRWSVDADGRVCSKGD